MSWEWRFPSEPGAGRAAADRIAEAARSVGMSAPRADLLAAAAAEAVLNAAEHAGGFDPSCPVIVRVVADGGAVAVSVIDVGLWEPVDLEVPDLSAKLIGAQSSRGWGRFLMSHLADDVHDVVMDGHHVTTVRMAIRH